MSDLNKLKKFLDDDYRTAYLDSHVKGSIAYQIQALREHLGLNQTEFGALVGMPQAVISRLENAENGGVNINTLLKVARGLGIALAVRFCDFEAILAEDVSPSGLLVEDIHKTVSRLQAPVTTQATTSSATLSASTGTGSGPTWQTIPIPNQAQYPAYPELETPNFGTFTPTQVSPLWGLTISV